MSRSHEPHRPFFPFGNPFRGILPKGSYLSPKLRALLNAFEETLAERLRKLERKTSEDLCSLPWMLLAMELLCETHNDVKSLITELELPVCDWDEKWIDVYLDNSVKLLDMCIAFSSELSRLNQAHLLLQCFLHNLDSGSSCQFVRARSSLDGWRQHITVKNPRLENSYSILENLQKILDLPKIKNSAKGKVLMRCMYGVKVMTLFICSIFATAFSGSPKYLLELNVPESFLWSQAFTDLQTNVTREVKNMFSSGRTTIVKEVEAVDTCVKKLYPMITDGVGPVETEEFKICTSDLGEWARKFAQGLDILIKQVDGFFQILLSGRDALLCNLRASSAISDDPMRDNVEPQL